MPYGTLYGLAASISDRTAFTLCAEPRAAKGLNRSSAEPPSPTNLRTVSSLIRRRVTFWSGA